MPGPPSQNDGSVFPVCEYFYFPAMNSGGNCRGNRSNASPSGHYVCAKYYQ